ncbi:MAG: trypsin-like serine protease [Alphaproteobacteria bacterium]|nr:MAG: trypsin-like serine protease [Alphaproteobacteria bacterium]
MKNRLVCLIALFLMSTGALAQVNGTESVEDKLARMRAAGKLPQTAETSFHRRAVDSTEAPWRAIGRVNVGGRAHCTGSLVAPNLVLTAGHCLYSKADDALVVPGVLHFVAGYHGGEYEGHSKVKAYEISPEFDPRLGPSPDTLMHDWALLTLEEPLGEKLGYLPFPPELLSEQKAGETLRLTLKSPIVTTAGYPGDRPHVLSLEEGCRVRAAAHKGQLVLTDCVALHGDSGGPVLQKAEDGHWQIIGIQSAATRHEGHIASMAVTVLAFWPAYEKLVAPESP